MTRHRRTCIIQRLRRRSDPAEQIIHLGFGAVVVIELLHHNVFLCALSARPGKEFKLGNILFGQLVAIKNIIGEFLHSALKFRKPELCEFRADILRIERRPELFVKHINIKQRTQTKVGDVTFVMKNGMLFITLPSGRRLSYVKPRLGENRFGGESVTYMGIDATKHWSRIESYGPKFVENIVQAVSRDILAYAMRTLSYCQIVGHVHDELIIECSPGVFLDAICEQMGRTPSWLPGIELRADGYECDYYMKQ